MYGGAKKTKKTKKKSKKGGKLNLDKLASHALLVSSAVASLSKGQQKTLKKKIKQKRTKMQKEMKKKVHKDKSGKKRIRSGMLESIAMFDDADTDGDGFNSIGEILRDIFNAPAAADNNQDYMSFSEKGDYPSGTDGVY